MWLALAAALQAAGVCWPFPFLVAQGWPQWSVQLLALAVYVHALGRAGSPAMAFSMGLLHATVWLACTFWWLFIALHTYGGLSAALAVVALVVLAAALGLYYALAAACYNWLAPRSAQLGALVFAALWTVAELARGNWLSGFGWGAIGYAHLAGPLSTFIPWVGVYGVGALAAWTAASLGMVERCAVGHRAALVGLLAAGALLHGQAVFTQTTGTLEVHLLQGNIAQDEKFEAGSGIAQSLAWYGEKMQGTIPGLTVAPETAIPLLPQDLPPGYWEGLLGRYRDGNGSGALLLGIPMGTLGEGYTNSVLGLQPGQANPWRYDKHHLVPFGEFIPTGFRWFTRMMHIPLGDFARGSLVQRGFDWQGQRLGANICYEDLYGNELALRFQNPALAPTIFVNASNLGWFGGGTALDQHLQIARMRSLEFERPFLLATNTGATAIVDYQGVVRATLARETRGVLSGVVEGRTGVTPYSWWAARFGLWPYWALALAVLLCALRLRQRR